MFRVLLLRAWTADNESVRVAIARTGLAVAITCVDFVAALHATLGRERFDVIVVDPGLGISRPAIEECLRDHELTLPIVVLETPEQVGESVHQLAQARRA